MNDDELKWSLKAPKNPFAAAAVFLFFFAVQ